MKKLLIAAILVLMIPLVGMAENQYSTLSDEELMNAFDLISIELESRHKPLYADLDSGFYLVGQDLPTGNYMITSSDKNVEGQMAVYPSLYDCNNGLYETIKLNIPKEATDEVAVYFEEGNCVVVNNIRLTRHFLKWSE